MCEQTRKKKCLALSASMVAPMTLTSGRWHPKCHNSAVRCILPGSQLPRAGRFDQHKATGYTKALANGKSLDPQAQEHANRMPTHPSKSTHRPALEPQGPVIGVSSPTRGTRQASTRPRKPTKNNVGAITARVITTLQ